ncbi:hypothetical protein EG352_08615 [Chryseobacterium indologenes]|uniref:Uncharacterized protein n=1 Tax=Chryseobacterium indologenes TaxID=253 RepID=A0AAD1DUX6_CHRID|nr:hypothetical protein EG352_08615 [Chryseobacterium indologenes]
MSGSSSEVRFFVLIEKLCISIYLLQVTQVLQMETRSDQFAKSTRGNILDRIKHISTNKKQIPKQEPVLSLSGNQEIGNASYKFSTFNSRFSTFIVV